MANITSTSAGKSTGRIDRDGVRRMVQVVTYTLIQMGLLFGAAGRLNWLQAWVYFGINVALLAANAIIMFRRNPELINRRGRAGENTKDWDRRWGVGYLALNVAFLVVAGLNGGRWGGAGLPLWVQVAGGAVGTGGFAFVSWAMAVNTHFETTVRIQEDRGHTVVTSGPYRLVRHPGYLGMMISVLGTCFLLDALWALIPAGLLILWVVVRTAREDRTLQDELPGYAEFTRQTRFRLVPGLW